VNVDSPVPTIWRVRRKVGGVTGKSGDRGISAAPLMESGDRNQEVGSQLDLSARWESD